MLIKNRAMFSFGVMLVLGAIVCVVGAFTVTAGYSIALEHIAGSSLFVAGMAIFLVAGYSYYNDAVIKWIVYQSIGGVAIGILGFICSVEEIQKDRLRVNEMIFLVILYAIGAFLLIGPSLARKPVISESAAIEPVSA